MERPERLDTQSADGAQLNLDALYQIAPSCFTEATDPKSGKIKRVVNFDVLRQLLGDDAVEDATEAYEFNWVGKQEARAEVLRPIYKTLRPVKEDSVDWDNTQNLYIEGDNLEVLKLLQKSYLGKVKMIYIDPPYNTGNDFVYHDDFSQSQSEYDAASGAVDELGNRFVKNTDSNGKYHSDWCSMVCSRLMVARSLLSEDGVIFISIGDDEEANLIKICDEVFGEHNFIASICHKHRASVSNDRIISENHNHLLFYAKDINITFANQKKIGDDPILDGFDKQDEKGAYKLTPVDGPGGAKKGNPHYEFLGVTGYWRYSKETMQKKYDEGLIVRTPNGLQQKYYLSQAQDSRRTVTTWWDDNFLTSSATKQLSDLMGAKTFDNPKNPNLILRALKMITHFDKECIILDFFSGSATTAHAVMQLNAEDGGKRKFIMVQLPEETAEVSEAYKAGYKNICEIGKERIRRAGKKIKEEHPEAKDLDTGFRVFRIDESNFENVERTPKDYNQDELDLFLNNIKSDRSDLDLLFGCMLDWGVQLSLPMNSEEVDGKMIYTVNDGDLVACFADKVTDKVVKAMADKQPLRVIFRDSCFDQDADKINIYETFKQLLDWSDKDVEKNIRVI
ncbi:site-specific DNA-methyltransferase [Segatella bryantii]|uniref:site-specific DNA-methyltransferase n=1 Tax=Segatella bryantii TaxID=77095 RepID=UPI0028534428|nr:site-specific DNA-methyltransferase [Segatella bryantii]MDR4930055.1 site-specific DNA-methyltransferase [Segatella bryantii]